MEVRPDVDTDRGPVPATAARQVTRAAPGVEDDHRVFAEFYRANYRELVKAGMYAGASQAQAEDAASSAMEYLMANWSVIQDPLKYGRVATVRYYYKEITRGQDRVRERLEQRRTSSVRVCEDPNLTAWEDQQFVMELLNSLPEGQRVVMACIVDDFKPSEIAELLGKSPAAIRQSLHARVVSLRRCK
jgi:RNA polymerase sigma factor (sigma-70 family)